MHGFKLIKLLTARQEQKVLSILAYNIHQPHKIRKWVLIATGVTFHEARDQSLMKKVRRDRVTRVNLGNVLDEDLGSGKEGGGWTRR
jgi:hypothetical protein